MASPEKQASVPAPLSHAERIAARDNAKARIITAHTSKIEKLDDERRAAHEAKSRAIEALDAEHVETHRAACIKAQRDAAEAFKLVVADFTANPTRSTAGNLASKFREVEANTLHSTGALLTRELGYAFAAACIDADPTTLPRFAWISTANSDVFGFLEEADFASRMCRVSGPSAAPNQLHALTVLERKIARIASEGPIAPESSALARWEALRFSGDHAAAQKAIASIEREERSPVEAAAWERVRAHSKGWSVLSAVTGLLSPTQFDK